LAILIVPIVLELGLVYSTVSESVACFVFVCPFCICGGGGIVGTSRVCSLCISKR